MAEEGVRPEGEPKDPASIAHFRILGRLGEGGMGVVYRAEDEALRRTVALKLLRDTAGDAETRQRFLREARSAAAIVHPSVAMVFQVGEADGRQYIAMELVEGENLRARLGRGKLDVATARDLATQMARGLAAAHEKGIVHRDLKPENVMITPDGVVKLLDFGLAKQGTARVVSGPAEVGLAKTETLVTSDEQRVMGTAEYMSPEQALGKRVDVRSDVFSFGVVLYEMLSGARPFHGTTTGELLVAIVHNPAPPLRTHALEVDAATEAIVTRCLAKAPAERFANAGEIVAALTGPTVQSGVARPVPKKVLVSAATVIVSVLVLAGASRFASRGSTPSARSPSSATVSAPEPSATAITDLPVPQSNRAEAIAAYRAGLQTFRDGAVHAAVAKFREAVTVDPGLGAAWVQLVASARWADLDATTREAFSTARQLRSRLGQRDQAFLDALEPMIDRRPVDFVEARVRLQALVERYPRDAELLEFSSFPANDLGQLQDGMAAEDRAIAVDPQFALAYGGRGYTAEYRGDWTAARAASQQCMAIAFASPACTRTLVFLDEVEGKCAEIEALGRQSVSAWANDPAGYPWLAEGIVGTGKPVAAALQALASRWALLPADARRPAELADRMRVELLDGDFVAAEGDASELEKAVGPDPGLSSHGVPARALVALYTEQGRLADAGRVAEEFLSKRDVWLGEQILTNFAVLRDATPDMLEARLRAGWPRARFEADRQRWLVDLRRQLPPFFRRYLWAHAYAALAQTPDEAVEALAALPSEPLPAFFPLTLVEASVGNAYRLAGQTDDAFPRLRSAVDSCRALDFPVEWVRAQLHLGEALEQKGDKPGACDAYAEVLRRWGHAKPRSVTADKARARSKALGCATP